MWTVLDTKIEKDLLIDISSHLHQCCLILENSSGYIPDKHECLTAMASSILGHLQNNLVALRIYSVIYSPPVYIHQHYYINIILKKISVMNDGKIIQNLHISSF